MVKRLLQDDFRLKVIKLSAAEKSEAVSQLEGVRRSASGKRLQKVSFLLAALGTDYTKNCDYLLGALRGCSVQLTDCDEDTAGLLIGLYEEGHHEVLQALLLAGRHSDGALSEVLGPFYCDVLTKAPTEFLAGVRRLGAPAQEAVCSLAGGTDGSGMPPQILTGARRRLKGIGDAVALRCLREIEKSNREIDAGNQ